MNDYIKLARVSQWIKNIFVLVPLVYSKHLFQQNFYMPALLGLFVFCLISSVVYIINDIVDVEADRMHPVKKYRPLATGSIKVSSAIVFASALFVVAFIFTYSLPIYFSLLALSYLVLNIFYSFILKNIVLVDIFTIASGFMLRVTAGAFVIHVEISSWLILTTMFLSLFLAVMKRRSEIVSNENEGMSGTRKVLNEYSVRFTEQLGTIAAAGLIISYALYSVSPRTVSLFETEHLIYTTPFVAFGIFRYMYLVYMNDKGENTVELLLGDRSMWLNGIAYVTATILIVYHILGN